jgi:hypothetical protein
VPRDASVEDRGPIDTGVPPEPAAQVVITELNANIDGSCDLIELEVLRGGDLAGWTVEHRQHRFRLEFIFAARG